MLKVFNFLSKGVLSTQEDPHGNVEQTCYFFFFPDFIYLFIYFLLYNTVLVLPYINMNLPRVYMCSQS